MPTKKPNAEMTLVTVAESIGSALGAVAARLRLGKRSHQKRQRVGIQKKARKSRHRAAARAFGSAARKSWLR